LDTGRWDLILDTQQDPVFTHIWAEIERGYDTNENRDLGFLIGGDLVVPVPSNYLRQVQTTGEYGPSYDPNELENGRANSRGIYKQDYSCIPHKGSGIFALGYPMPRSCWQIEVKDACGAPVIGAPIHVVGVSHGYVSDGLTNSSGMACVEVAQSESNNLDFDGDGISNETFDLNINVKKPLGTRLRSPDQRQETTPSQPGTCITSSECEVLQFQFENCLDPEPF
jgi:hypothetical protein